MYRLTSKAKAELVSGPTPLEVSQVLAKGTHTHANSATHQNEGERN